MDEVMETPRVYIDGARMRANIEKMAAIEQRSGVALRPHVKTHKIPAIARAQLEAGAEGITVARSPRQRSWPTPASRTYS